MPSRGRWAAAALIGVLVAGCGVPSDAAPRTLPTDDVPFGLLSQRAEPSPEPSGTRATRLYLVRGDRVAPTIRRSLQVPTPLEVVRALVEGAVGDEAAQGLRTAVPPVTVVRDVTTDDGGVVTVDLSTEFTAVGSEQQILAVAQVVYSLTEMRGITAVRLLIEGQPVQVPREDGSLTSAPLVRADYDAVAAA